MSGLQLDQTLLDAAVEATIQGLSMTGIAPIAIGASKFPRGTGELMVIVSLQGTRNGTMTLSFSKKNATFLADKLMGEDRGEFDEDTIDAVCELGNIVAGRYKDLLGDSEFRVEGISLPSLIIGQSYDLYHYRGITTVSVDFEIEEISMVDMRHKFFSSSVSFVQR